MSQEQYQVVILGGGSGGYACALRAAQLGLRVALIEQDKLGGTCLHSGCIPTKALLHAAEVADSTREAGRFGVRANFEAIDMPAVRAYQDGIVARLYQGLQGLVAGRKVDLIAGRGRLVPGAAGAPPAVEVDGRRITGQYLVCATGSYPRTLPGIEIAGRVMTSEGVLKLDHVPASVVVLGGGVIGVEFASVFRSFGAEVTVLEALPRLVPAEDAAVSKQLERAFRKRGITVRTGVSVTGVSQDPDRVRVELSAGDPIEAELVVVAVGRGPRTEDCGYEQVGLAMERGFVLANERCQTNLDRVFAVGDIVPGLQLAHRGFAQGIFVAEEIAGLAPTPIEDRGIPRVTYCDPEIASVGLTEEQAKAAHGQVEALEYGLGGNGKSQILGTAGFVKLVRVKDGPVVGVHMVGARMGEQVGEAQLIVNWEALPQEVAALIHAHPTQNEALGEAHLALAGKALHAHA